MVFNYMSPNTIYIQYWDIKNSSTEMFAHTKFIRTES